MSVRLSSDGKRIEKLRIVVPMACGLDADGYIIRKLRNVPLKSRGKAFSVSVPATPFSGGSSLSNDRVFDRGKLTLNGTLSSRTADVSMTVAFTLKEPYVAKDGTKIADHKPCDGFKSYTASRT